MRRDAIAAGWDQVWFVFRFVQLGDFIVELIVSSGGLPVGVYAAEFLSAEPYDQNSDKYGPGVSLKFRVIGGQHDGQEMSRICGAKLSQKSALAKFAVGLKGSQIEAGERINFDNFKGVRGSIIVQQTESGGTRIEAFMRS